MAPKKRLERARPTSQPGDCATDDVDRRGVAPDRARKETCGAPLPAPAAGNEVGGVAQGACPLGPLRDGFDARSRLPQGIARRTRVPIPGRDGPNPPEEDGQKCPGGSDERDERIFHEGKIGRTRRPTLPAVPRTMAWMNFVLLP